jgi:hypothetical protein
MPQLTYQMTKEQVEGLDENIRELYTEQDGKFILTGVGGIKTEHDIANLNTSLQKERDAHKLTKEKYKVWENMDHDEIQAKLDRIPELEAAAVNKDELDSKVEDLAEKRVASRIAPVKRENEALKQENINLVARVEALEKEKTDRTISDAVIKIATEKKVVVSALEDVKMLASSVFEVTDGGAILVKENQYGMTQGLDPEGWLAEMQAKRPHWWPPAVGGDAPGGGGGGFDKNPWSHEYWNVTEQGRIINDKGTEKAEQMAKAAGTSVNGVRPAPKRK